jgi:hypothetical protein
MGKTGDMADTIKELRNAATEISEAANWLAEQFIAAEQEPAYKNPQFTLESVRSILAEKSRAGHTDEIHALLNKYGADKLSGIDSRDYAALLAEVEALKNAT